MSITLELYTDASADKVNAEPISTPFMYWSSAERLCNAMAGGTGAVGSLVALWLAGHEAKRIVLLGRSGRFPADSPLAAYRHVSQWP
jgi:KR domain